MTTDLRIIEQLEAVRRELGLRRACYPKWVENKRMTKSNATKKLAAMEAIERTLEAFLNAEQFVYQDNAENFKIHGLRLLQTGFNSYAATFNPKCNDGEKYENGDYWWERPQDFAFTGTGKTPGEAIENALKNKGTVN